MHPKAQTCASCILTISRAIIIYQKQTENHQNDLTSYPLKHQHFPHFGHLVVISQTVGHPLTSWASLILWSHPRNPLNPYKLGWDQIVGPPAFQEEVQRQVVKGNYRKNRIGNCPMGPMKFGTFEDDGFTTFQWWDR